MVNYGPSYGKLVVIVDVVDQNRVWHTSVFGHIYLVFDRLFFSATSWNSSALSIISEPQFCSFFLSLDFVPSFKRISSICVFGN